MHTSKNVGARRTHGALVALAIVVGLGAVVASGSSNTASKVDSGATKPGGSKTAEAFKVGDEVKLGDWSVKVYGVTDPLQPTSEFLKPKDGFRGVSLDTEVKNISSAPASVSSLLFSSLLFSSLLFSSLLCSALLQAAGLRQPRIHRGHHRWRATRTTRW